MLVCRAEMFPVECVVRGYISGSAWKEYKATGTVCGIKLPRAEGIRTVARTDLHARDQGDLPVMMRTFPFDQMCELVGVETAEPASRSDAEYLQESRGLRAPARHHHRRHQV